MPTPSAGPQTGSSAESSPPTSRQCRLVLNRRAAAEKTHPNHSPTACVASPARVASPAAPHTSRPPWRRHLYNPPRRPLNVPPPAATPNDECGTLVPADTDHATPVTNPVQLHGSSTPIHFRSRPRPTISTYCSLSLSGSASNAVNPIATASVFLIRVLPLPEVSKKLSSKAIPLAGLTISTK